MRSEEQSHEVVVYHDETRNVFNGTHRGHVLFFVPRRLTRKASAPLFPDEEVRTSPLRDVFAEIQRIRERYGTDRKFHFSELSGKAWHQSDAATREVMELGVDSLRHKRSRTSSAPICARLAVMFYPTSVDLHRFGYGGSSREERRIRYDETMLRILLKGALHYLYDERSRVVVRAVVADGASASRPLDPDRVIEQLSIDGLEGRTPLRDYARFHPKARISHVVSNHREHACDSSAFVHANLLQMADLLLGGVIRSCVVGCADYVHAPRVGQRPIVKKDAVGYPVKQMLMKVDRGAGFRHSGHYRAFSVSKVDFDFGGSPRFLSLDARRITIAEDALKLDFGLESSA